MGHPVCYIGWFHSKRAWSKKSFYSSNLAKNEFWELRRTPPNKISCITLDYNTKYGILGTKIVKNPFLTYLSYFSSCCSAKQLLAQRSGPEEVRQCTSCAVLASREWERFVRGRDNLFMLWLGVIHGPLLQNLVSVWRGGWFWKWS